MTDMKLLSDKRTLPLPAASYPVGKVALPQQPPAATKAEAQAKPKIEEPDFDFLGATRRDGALVVFELLGGDEITGSVNSFGRYAISVTVGEGARPEIVFKHALRRMRRVSPMAPKMESG